jgi:hypothetical protein
MPNRRPGSRGRGAQVADCAARTHAAERCANAAIHTFSCAPSPERPEEGQMTTSTGLAATAYQELAAAPYAAVITIGGPGHAGASWPVSRRC